MSEKNSSTDAAALYAKATRLELDGQYDKAFQLYLKCAEEHMILAKQFPLLITKHQADARRAVERAENIKKRKSQQLTPVKRDAFAKGQQLFVLSKGSSVSGRQFPLWDAAGPSTINDLTQPTLSPEQLSHGAVWRKPSGGLETFVDGNTEVTGALTADDIIQHVVSDCSLCASIAVCLQHNCKFGTHLVLSSLHSQEANGPARTHSLKVLFNGGYRKANIDDMLPTYPDGTLMCMSTGAKNQLWPSLVEKAYMKLMGGYDFPGSLSSTDLHTLIGWIPETIEMASPDFERERSWKRICTAYKKGQCMMTVGTGRNPPDVAHLGLSMNLLPAHCYAVIDIQDKDDERRMTILDNWVEGSSQHRNQIPLEGALQNVTLDDGNNEESVKPHSCIVPWDTVCTVFNGLFLSWDPSMFQHQLQFHGSWKKDTTFDADLPRSFIARLYVEGKVDSEVWILLTRHVVDTRRETEYISLSVQEEAGLVASSDLSIRGAYTNNTHVLAKTRCKDCILSLMTSYDGTYDDIGFTLTVYSSVSPVSWLGSGPQLTYSEQVPGALTINTSGGNASLPTFMINPQYHLRIHPDSTKQRSDRSLEKSEVEVTLAGDRRLPFNVSVVWSRGQRITEISGSDIVLSTGAYKFGHTAASKSLKRTAGDYTIIVSAFEPRQTGAFNLKVDCSTRFEIKPIPQEGSGMFALTERGSWTVDTAGGGPSFNRYMSNPVFELKLPVQCQVVIRLQLLGSAISLSPLNVTIFRATPRRTLGAHVATSGPYSDAVCGVATQANLPAGSYFIIPSTYLPGIEAGFKLLLYTAASRASLQLTTLAQG